MRAPHRDQGRQWRRPPAVAQQIAAQPGASGALERIVFQRPMPRRSGKRSAYSVYTVLAACAIFAGVFIAIFLLGKAVEKCQQCAERRRQAKQLEQRKLLDEAAKKAS